MAHHNGSASKLPSVPGDGLGGRPTVYCPEVEQSILVHLTEGHSLRSICSRDNMPAISTVMGWLFDKDRMADGFAERYARAREAQAEVIADETLDIADSVPVESAAINKARLRVDVRHKAAAVFNPERFSDKRHGGATAGTVNVQINIGPAPEPVVILDNGEADKP